MGLSPILWFCFLLFALLIIVFLTLVQVIQYRAHYRQKIVNDLAQACTEIKNQITVQIEYFEEDIAWTIVYYANKYSISIYFMSERPEEKLAVFPAVPVGQEQVYVERYLYLRDFYKSFEEDPWEMEGEEEYKTRISFLEKDFAAHASTVTVGQERAILYLYSSFENLNSMLKDMVLNAVYSGLFAITLCFIMSGFVSVLVSQPVASVTKRAKTLANGDYDTNFSGHYFIREVNDLSDALNYANSELSKTDKIQKELIANVSHDFRTPLTMIKAYAAMIQEISGEDPVKRQKHTQIIIDEADRLAALVRDLLDLSRLQAGVYSFDYTVFNLSEDLYSVANRFGFLEQTKGYKIVTEIEDDLYTYANKPRVEQVLYNLIGNAVNYTGEDKTVVIRLFKKETCSRFEVIDSGRGIPPDEVATIWERYYRSSETHKRPVEGTGLGLSIVKNVLKMHNFNFGVESEMGKGSCFWVEFPAPEPTPEKDGASE